MSDQAPTPGIVDVVRRVAADRRADLDRLKRESSSPERADLWMALLRSFGTLGRSAGWSGLKEPGRLARLSYAVLAAELPARRVVLAEDVFREAGVRLPAQKAAWLAANVEIIKIAGGIQKVQRDFDNLRDADAIMKFLRGFKGIGKKYARNIPMDSYHLAFRGTIAVDARIKSISKVLGLKFDRYEDEERYYVALANAADLEPWELDRLLYGFTQQILDALPALDRGGSRATPGSACDV